MGEDRFYDVVVIGGGAAGLTAALYLARARYRVLVLEKERIGGQITLTDEVVNYPGVAKTSGAALTEEMRRQATAFGAEILVAEVKSLDATGEIKTVSTDRGSFSAFGLLLATGARPRAIGFPGEERYRGRGVAYCATCDGEFFTGREIFVIGGGYAAAEESVFLTRYASHVTVLVREDAFTCARAVADAALSHPKITVLTNTEVVSVTGDETPNAIRYRNNRTGEESVFTGVFGVFVFAGCEPQSELLRGIAELDPAGYVVTDRCLKTSVDGVYAAGDVCVKHLRQVVTAVGDGAAAATELERHAARMQEKTGRTPRRPVSEPPHAETAEAPKDTSASPFTPEIYAQLRGVYAKMTASLCLAVYPDGRPVSDELIAYVRALADTGTRIVARVEPREDAPDRPFVRVLRADGSDTGLAFHGVPGGHEFTSFVLGLYNAAGPGQAIDPALRARIEHLPPHRMRLIVSLSCTMCPDLVTAAQHIAALHPAITAEVFDVGVFPALRERYNIMSVPCLVLDDDRILFGRKNLEQLVALLEEG